MDEKLLKALQELEQRLDAGNVERFNEIQKRLLSLEERDTAPNDEKVTDLEKKLADSDAELGKLKEQMRLLQAEPTHPDIGLSRAGKVDFSGMFIRDIDAVRQAVRRGNTDAIDTSLFVGGIGELPVEVADAFIDLIVEEQTTLSRITTRRMNGPTARIDELRYAERQMVAATEGTAPSVADALTIAARTLTSVEVILAEDITLSFLEDNIERQGVEAHIASILARKFGTDLNDLAWNGDTTTGTFLVINNGFSVLALADSDVNDVDLTGNTSVAECFSDIMKGMPSRFMAIPDLVFFCPTGAAQNYADEFAARETATGDGVFLNGFPSLRYFGRPVIPEPHLKETTAGVDTDELIMLTSASRLVNGIQRNFRMDAMWQPRKRVVEYTLSARTDVQYVSGEIISRGHSLPAALQ